ncbi:hypothetical protein RHSIM_Rhsim03G0074100 [Rhododendron simsii]|uniref:Uncharacterized protein n=1 Tax=Rhododendron simsii TaxID=118357 RepID=A0A834HD52_RHOSS|nr:hypothetical protein RHSIM_Rhsim03G0074100 [Rhododendron simsii]
MRVNIEKPRHQTIVTSDVQKQILVINQKAREEGEKKQLEAEELQKLNEMVMLELMVIKKRDDGRVKTLKTNKDEHDKIGPQLQMLLPELPLEEMICCQNGRANG